MTDSSAARLLALDTATDTLYLALQTPAGMLARTGSGAAQASATLLPQIAELLREAGVAAGELDALACGIGPGAFTGLRTACSVVQGLAFGVGRPVIALPTLLAVAESACQQGAAGAVWAVQDARMGEVYAALYERDADGWQVRVPPALQSPGQLLAQAQARPGVLAGNALKAFPALAAVAGAGFPDAVPDGAALMALARSAWQRGDVLDASQALPLYVRDKVAQTTAERLGQRPQD